MPEAPSRVGSRKRQRGTPPDVVGRGPLLSSPGLRLAVVVIVRDEAPYLEEWLSYHHALGVEHVFLYDNGSRDALHEVVEPWINHGLLTLVHWPLPGGQIDAYSHALRFYGPSVEWLAFFDVDEFVVPLIDDDIPTLLARWPQAADIRMPRVDFGFSGHREPPEGLTIEAYTEVADVFGRDPAKPPRVKSVVQPRSISAVGIHTATVADLPFDASGQPVPRETVGPACHPSCRSTTTTRVPSRSSKPSASGAAPRVASPVPPSPSSCLPQRVDRSAVRFAERTRQSMALAAQPGAEPLPLRQPAGACASSRTSMTWASSPSSPSPTSWLARQSRAVSRACASRTATAGTGFLADLSATGHAPRRGDLSGSVHLAPLLERARGRLESSWAGQPGQVAATLRWGTARAADDGWRILGARGVAEVNLPIEAAERRRCYALGIVLRTDAGLVTAARAAPPGRQRRCHDGRADRGRRDVRWRGGVRGPTGARQHGRARPAHGLR